MTNKDLKIGDRVIINRNVCKWIEDEWNPSCMGSVIYAECNRVRVRWDNEKMNGYSPEDSDLILVSSTNESKTIEQLAKEYQEKQNEIKAMTIKVKELETESNALFEQMQKQLEPYGFVIEKKQTNQEEQKEEPEEEQLVITDWRYLKKGDIIWWSGDSDFESGEYVIDLIEHLEYQGACPIRLTNDHWIDTSEEQWKFVSRPNKREQKRWKKM